MEFLDGETIKWLFQAFGALGVMFLLVTRLVGKNTEFMMARAETDEARQKSYDDRRSEDNRAWLDMVAGLKLSIEAQTMTIKQSNDIIKDRDIVSMAYQNTSSNALNELVVNVQKLAGVPEGVRKTNDTLGTLSKQQTVMSEGEARHELEMKQQLAKTNNALVEMQKELKRMSSAMEKLPTTMQATIAPLVGMMQSVLSTAQATQARLDDMPFMPVGDNHHADLMTDKTFYASTEPHPLTPSPLHGEGELVTPLANDVKGNGDGEK